ncbi:MAG: DUF6159 family protein [Candidatus Diapherotrites archaeon]
MTISQSWDLVKESFSVLRKDKEMLLFPLISGITALLLLASFIVPIFFLGGTESSGAFDTLWLVWLFAYYVLSYFIVIFFNVGLVTCAHIRLSGGDPTFRDGLNNAFKNIGKIFVWALIAATVGMVLRFLSEKAGLIGRIIIAILGMAWSFLTFFVVPVLVFEGVGPIESIKRSGSLFKKTWGENIAGQVSMGFIFFLLIIGGAIVLLVPAFLSGMPLAIVAAIALLVAYIVVLSIVSSALDGIFKTALYIYATTGKVPEAFKPELVETAFQRKPETAK